MEKTYTLEMAPVLEVVPLSPCVPVGAPAQADILYYLSLYLAYLWWGHDHHVNSWSISTNHAISLIVLMLRGDDTIIFSALRMASKRPIPVMS